MNPCLGRGSTNLRVFCAGNVAIQMLWPGDVGNCRERAPHVFSDLAVAPPLEGSRGRAMQLYVDKYMVWKDSANPDAAFDLLKHLATPVPNYEMNDLGGVALPSRGAMEDFALFRSDPWKGLVENLRFARLRQILPQHWDIQPAMSRWVEQAALGQSSITEALPGMDREVD